MMTAHKIILLSSLAIFATFCGGNVYEGFKIYDIRPNSKEDFEVLQLLRDFEGEKRSLDFLSFHKNLNDDVRIMVKPEDQKFVENYFSENKLSYGVSVDDVQRQVDDELEEVRILSSRRSEILRFDRYYRHAEINRYLESLAQESFPHAEVTVKNVGRSYERREIKTITITSRDGRSKNSIFMDAGIHAREWIAPATALYFITQLVDPQSNYSRLLNYLDFVIMPLVNPDGYEYTFNRYRLWRKTRSINGLLDCRGVDGNRNYGSHWNEGGSSSNKCSETYHGPRAFSEVETRISRDVMEDVKENCKFFLTFHSYGNYLIYPFSYAKKLPENWRDHEDVAQAGAKAIREYSGKNYTVGSTASTLYPASGCSEDQAHEVSKIPIAIVMELTGGGQFGFDLPASEIDKNVKESAAGISAMSDMIIKKFN